MLGSWKVTQLNSQESVNSDNNKQNSWKDGMMMLMVCFRDYKGGDNNGNDEDSYQPGLWCVPEKP